MEKEVEVRIDLLENLLLQVEDCVCEADLMSCDVPGLRRQKTIMRQEKAAIDEQKRTIGSLKDELDKATRESRDKASNFERNRQISAKEGNFPGAARLTAAMLPDLMRKEEPRSKAMERVPLISANDQIPLHQQLDTQGIWKGILPKIMSLSFFSAAKQEICSRQGSGVSAQTDKSLRSGYAVKGSPNFSDGDANSRNAEQSLAVMRVGTIWNAVSYIHTSQGQQSWKVRCASVAHDVGVF